MRIDRGVVAAIGAAALFGLSTPLAKILVTETDPLMLAGLLYLGSGIGLAAVLLVRAAADSKAAISRPKGTDAWWLLGAIAAGGVFGPCLLMYGLQTTDSASASLALNLEGVLTALLAWFVFKENFNRRIASGMAMIVAGGVLLSFEPTIRGGGYIGPMMIAGACLAWAIDNNLTRKVSSHDAMFIACIKGLVAGATSVSLALLYAAPIPASTIALQAGLVGFLGYGLSLSLFVVALRRLGTARTGAYFSIAPFAGATFAVALGAPLTVPLVFAGLLMGVGVWLHITEHHEHPHRHLRQEHAHAHVHDAHHHHRHEPDWDGTEPHSHPHIHEPMEHAHAHFPDVHHRHVH